MSTFRVTLEELEILKHPGADSLELARVGEYRAVVPKGAYKTGDVALYIPEAAVLPDELIEEIGLTGRLAGSDKNRVKAIRLRGELSQGIVCLPQLVRDADFLDPQTSIGVDFAEQLGIYKWVPPVPIHLAGEVEPCDWLGRWPDIENIKRYPNLFTEGELVTVTEKIHGSCCIISYKLETGELALSSKGLGSKGLAIKANDSNAYWRAVDPYLEAFDAAAKDIGSGVLSIYGEVYGAGIQDLGYGVDAKQRPAFAVFDAADANGFFSGTYLEDFGKEYSLPTVPVVFDGDYNYEAILELASGTESVSGRGANIREGVVVRPYRENRRCEATGSRQIGKIVSEAYLTRKGKVTEFE